MYGPKYYALMRGDPGFFKSIGKFVGGAVKTLAPIAIGAATGGIGGIAAKGLLGVAAKTAVGRAVGGTIGKIGGGILGKIGARVVPGAGVVAGGATGTALASTALTKFSPPMLQIPRGLATPGIFGAAAGGAAIGAAGTYGLTKKGTPRMRRRGRMNPLNPRAARRAITRIKSVNKLCSRIQAQLPRRRAAAPRARGRRA